MKTVTFNRLQSAFEEATNKAGKDRDRFIDELTRSDPELAHEVRSLLFFYSDSTNSLEGFQNNRTKTRLCDPANRKTLPVARGYLTQRRIGTGGQADVYLAREESTGQEVAIKVFRGYSLTDAQRNRIDAETQALVRLQLPNVVAILDRGQTACGREFLVTRYVDGLPLDQAATQLLPGRPREFLNLFAKVGDTLARVHRQGIIHRDLKPSNILVDQSGEPYLLDFGLASFFADPSGRLLTATPESAFQGSILWASPEQVDASFGSIDCRSDIYSLGVVLYQSLTGRFPYPVDGGMLAVAQEIVKSSPTKISARSLPDGVPELEKIVFRALEKQPQRRFQTAEEFAAVLHNLPNAKHTETMAVPKIVNRKRLVRLGLAAIVAAVGAVLWMGLNSDGHSSTAPQQSEAVQELDDRLVPFGVVPPEWIQVGTLQNNLHELERSDLSIDGDFVLRLQVSADRSARAGFTLTLVGAEGGDDVVIFAEKVNTWSDNESWQFRTPAGNVLKGLPVGVHTFILKRQGKLFTLAADAVHLPERNDSVLATFATGGRNRFESIRIASTGPVMRLERVQLHAKKAIASRRKDL